MANRVRDLTGAKVGKLTVVDQAGRDDMGRALWNCRCECGNTVVRRSSILTGAMRDGKASHCGCSPYLKTHGLSKANRNLYWVWAAIIQRCENDGNKDYPGYGGRGIRICSEWRRSFEKFHAWAMESGYAKGMTIERIDVDGNYCPENCTWIENERQSLNQRQSAMITYNGKTQHLSDWAAEIGISYKTLRGRLFQYGWSAERALTEKPRKGKNQYG